MSIPILDIGSDQDVRLFGVPLLGVSAENGRKLAISLAFALQKAVSSLHARA